MSKEVTGIILAGGKSSRMGKDKGLMELNGQKLVNHVLHVVQQVCKNVFIISNQPGYENLNTPVYEDILKHKGPIGGLHAGLTYSNTPYNLLLACDMPHISNDLLKYLLKNLDGNEDAVVPQHRAQPEPLCAIYSKSCLRELENLINANQLKMQEVLTRFRVKHVAIDNSLPFYSSRLFMNINTLNEFEELAIE